MTKRILWDGDTFERNGRTYRIAVKHDDCMSEPWKEHDGHGIVSDWTSRDKYPGERVLASDRRSKRYYDIAETIKIAKRDGWGLGAEDEAKLAQALGREPTRNEIVAQAVERDFQHLRAWCNDEWQWVYIVVEHIESGESESLGGIESDDDYLSTLADELADEIAHRLDTEMAREIEASSHLHATP